MFLREVIFAVSVQLAIGNLLIAPEISIDTSRLLATTDNRFLSLALDSSLMQHHWLNFDFELPRILTLAQGLSPAYLRVGGTMADFAFFDPNCTKEVTSITNDISSLDYQEEEDYLTKKDLSNFTFCGSDWIKLNRFTDRINLTFLFDLNVMNRNQDGSWNKDNAEKLLNFSSKLGYTNIAWELGNEPNSLKNHFKIGLDGLQLGKDFYRLKKLLNKFPLYKDSTLVGPDVNSIDECPENSWVKLMMVKIFPWLGGYLKPCVALKYMEKVHIGSRGVLDALTWHQYYLNGNIATLEDFLNHRNIEKLSILMDSIAGFLQREKMSDKPIWLGETASAYGGGALGLSDRYVSGFLWLNKLGISATKNYQVVIRQTLFNGQYALIGRDLNPNPDYWLSLIYKRLVSNQVLKINRKGNFPSTLNIYGHCTNNQYGYQGSVTLFGINMSNSSVTFNLDLPFSQARVHQFSLTPKNGNLTERSILLNGQELKLTPDEGLPDLIPMMMEPSKILNVPAYGMSFWVLIQPDVGNICK